VAAPEAAPLDRRVRLAGVVKRDPKPRADGLCALKGCRRPIVLKRQRGVPAEAYMGEMFCSNTCCRKWHGCELKPNYQSARSSNVAMSKTGDQATEDRRRYQRLHIEKERAREREHRQRKREEAA
jgi:hypothetical protein